MEYRKMLNPREKEKIQNKEQMKTNTMATLFNHIDNHIKYNQYKHANEKAEYNIGLKARPSYMLYTRAKIRELENKQ